MSTGKSKYHVSKWTPISINKSLLDEAYILFNENDRATFSNIEKLANPGTTENQIQILKLISKTCTQDGKLQEGKHLQYLIKLLTKFYLEAQPKNPMKSAASKLLLMFPSETHILIAREVSVGLIKLIALSKDGDFLQLHSTTNIINSCFDNFSIGITAVDICLLDVLVFLSECLQRNVAELGSELSPTLKMERCQHTHSITQVLVTVLQKCQTNINKIIEESRISVFGDVLKCATMILSYDDIPMDTTTNCGLIVVLLVAVLEKEDGLLKLASSNLPVQLERSGVNYSTPTCRLNICMGLLNTLTVQQQSLLVPNTATPVVASILGELLALGDFNSSESSFVLGVNRAMILLTRNLCQMTLSNKDSSHLTQMADDDVVAMVTQCLPFVWTHLDHYMDSIRHAARNILQNLVAAGVTLKRSIILSKILDDVSSISSQKKSKYVGLTILAKQTDCQQILDKIPDLVNNLLAALEDLTLQNHVACTMETFVVRFYSVFALPRWIDMWVRPIVRAYGTSVNAGSCLENVLASALVLCPTCLQSLHGQETPLKVTLVCIRIGRRKNKLNETSSDGDESKWKGLITYDTLRQALYHRDQEVRLLALALIVESRKSTEPFTTAELDLIGTALKYNVNVEDQAARQSALVYFKQALIRFSDGAVAMRRREAKRKERGDIETADTSTLAHYASFSMWLVEWCFSCLFPGANVGRRGTALTVLSMCVEYLRVETIGQDLWTVANGDLLLETLKDTYESNKILAYRLLITFPAAALRFNDITYMNRLVSVSLQLVSSNRPPDSVTASYILRTLAHYAQSEQMFSGLLPNPTAPSVNVSANHHTDQMLSAVRLLTNQLAVELDVAKRSLLIAATSGPMYGCLFCIRALLQDVDMNNIANIPDWQQLFTRLVAMCFELTATVAPVVNNSSPEGHLPMDFEPVVDSAGDGAPVTAQMVLLCAWRTVKEAALFLGDVAERAPITDGSGMSGLVTEGELLDIGDHLTSLLSETKHRGAFEQAYVGFCQLSARLWSHLKLHQIPTRWLQETLEAIETGEKLCATRRGAGLPFIVQALLTTELSTGVTPKCFHPSMSKLLDLAARGVTIDTRTNALNLLRALFRHALLGDLVTPHVTKGIQVAVAGFKTNAWAERNSATLLFSALVTRVFGVRRHRELLGSKDRMTGRVFFTRYPALYQTLRDELVQGGHDDCKADSRYPALLLLARLYPSALEGTESLLQLSVFIPLVQECATSRVLKTRVLAAKALVPLVTPNIYVSTLDKLFDTVARSTSENHRHGCLLQILHLLHELPPSLSTNTALTSNVQRWMSTRDHILSSRNYLLMQVFAQVLHCFVSSFYANVPVGVWEELREKVFGSLRRDLDDGHLRPQFKIDYKLGKSIYEESAAQLLLEIDLASFQDSAKTSSMQFTICQLLQLPSCEIVKVTLDFLVNLFTTETVNNPETAVQLNVVLHEKLIKSLKDSVHLSDVLLSHVNSENNYYRECRSKVFQVLHYLPNILLKLKPAPHAVLKYLLELCNYEDESVNFAILQCISPIVNECRLLEAGRLKECVVSNMDVWINFAETILSFTASDRPVACRLAVAEVLVEHESLFCREFPKLPAVTLCKLWASAVALHLDEDSDVRARVSALCSGKQPVMPQRALETLLDRFTRDIAVGSGLWQCWGTCLLAWSLQGLTLEGLDSEQQECLFDRGESNMYAEEALLTDLACKQLSIAPFKQLSTLDVPPELVAWLVEECLPGYEAEKMPSNFDEFVSLINLRFNTISVEGLRITADPHHFLVRENKYRLLDIYKVQKVLEVMRHVI